MGDFHVKKIILPSGKSVEIVYFHAEPGVMEATPDEPLDSMALELCGECESDLMQPSEWHELDPGRWEIARSCPNCGWSTAGVHGEDEVERYDVMLNEGTDEMIELLDELAHENMAAEIDRFVAALNDGHIQPMDF